jgi:hypothetical protein
MLYFKSSIRFYKVRNQNKFAIKLQLTNSFTQIDLLKVSGYFWDRGGRKIHTPLLNAVSASMSLSVSSNNVRA